VTSNEIIARRRGITADRNHRRVLVSSTSTVAQKLLKYRALDTYTADELCFIELIRMTSWVSRRAKVDTRSTAAREGFRNGAMGGNYLSRAQHSDC
jgi:hypothetical protein